MIVHFLRVRDAPERLAAASAEFHRLVVDAPKAQPLVMGIALHPYLVGQPYRLRHLRRALEHIVSSNKIWFTTPGEICTHVDGLGF